MGARDLDAAGGELRVIPAGPDGRLRQWRCRTTGRQLVRANVDTPRTRADRHAARRSRWDNCWYIGSGRPGWSQAAAKWPLAGHVNGRPKRMGLCGATCL